MSLHTHTHPSHSQTSRFLSTSLSLGIPVPHHFIRMSTNRLSVVSGQGHVSVVVLPKVTSLRMSNKKSNGELEMTVVYRHQVLIPKLQSELSSDIRESLDPQNPYLTYNLTVDQIHKQCITFGHTWSSDLQGQTLTLSPNPLFPNFKLFDSHKFFLLGRPPSQN